MPLSLSALISFRKVAGKIEADVLTEDGTPVTFSVCDYSPPSINGKYM
jgi:hypothetical protein